MRIKAITLCVCALLLCGCVDDCASNLGERAGLKCVARSTLKKPDEKLVLRHTSLFGGSAGYIPQICRVSFLSGDHVLTCGTGFFVAYENRKYFVTAAHVMAGFTQVSLRGPAGELDVSFTGHFVDYERDVLVAAISGNVSCFSLYPRLNISEIPVVGELYKPTDGYSAVDVTVYGYPSGGNELRETNGTAYQVNYFKASYPFLLSTAKVQGGMSGGPWIDKKTGAVVAVTSKVFGTMVERENGKMVYGSAAAPVNVIYEAVRELTKE